jgi:hypothetical protein
VVGTRQFQVQAILTGAEVRLTDTNAAITSTGPGRP